MNSSPQIHSIREATLTVSASDSRENYADYRCNGTNDNVEIQAALDALPATGGEVKLLDGTYIIEASITLDNNQTLRGCGPNTILKVIDGINADLDVIRNVDWVGGNNRIFVADLTLDGNQANRIGGNQSGINFQTVGSATGATSPGALVINCIIEEFRWMGITLNTVYHITISNNTFRNCVSRAIRGETVTDCIVSHNIVEDTSVDCLQFLSASYCVINDNIFKGDGGDALAINTGNHCIIIGNIIDASSTPTNDGIVVIALTYSVVRGNIIYHGAANGIDLSTNSNYNLISGNIIEGFDDFGIYLSGCDHNIISENICYGNSQAADNTDDNIFLVTSNYNLIRGNTCRDGGGANQPRYGINISDVNSNKNIVDGNDLHDSGRTANFNDAGTCTIVRGNRGYVTKIPVVQKIGPCAIAGAATVHALIVLAAAEQDITAAITDPDVYRCVSITTQRTGGAVMTGDVVITGNGWNGAIITDTITIVDSGTALGVVPFKTVTNIHVPVWTNNDGGDQVSVGCCDKLGLYRPINVAGDFLEQARKAAAATIYTIEASGAIDATNETINIATTGVIVVNDWLELSYNAEDL